MGRRARKEVIDETTVGAYHVWSRVVQRAYLLGYDRVTKRDFSHRKEWMVARLAALTSVFAVECLDHAILDNHFHAILRNRPELVAGWSDDEVARRWLRITPARLKLEAEPTAQEIAELTADRKRLAAARKQLSSVSWFMACLKEPVARLANAEARASGPFWAGRFGCEALEDDAALLVCSLYVNLNLVRAGLTERPEEGRYTSSAARCADRKGGDAGFTRSGWLAPLHVDGDGYDGVGAGRRPSNKGFLEVTLPEYLELLDEVWRAEAVAQGVVGALPHPPILQRLGIDLWVWETTVRWSSRRFRREQERVDENRSSSEPGAE